jgi:DNA primase catalytic core
VTDPQIYTANAAALAHWQDDYSQRVAVEYLRSRGIDATTLAETYTIGYARPGWTNLIDALRADGFHGSDLLTAGLAVRTTDGHLIDRFRSRVMFPIRTAEGPIAGFIGRALDPDARTPKYLNSPATATFHKGELLYGLHEGESMRGFRPVIVEGPTDALAIAVTAFRAGGHDLLPLALSGTALTKQHAATIANLVRRAATQPVLAYDGDDAGQRAALAAGELLRTVGLRPAIAILPSGRDPADHLTTTTDLSNFRAYPTGTAISLPEAVARRIITEIHQRWDPDWPETKVHIARAIGTYLTTHPSDERAKAAGPAFAAAAAQAGIHLDTLLAAARPLVDGSASRPGAGGHQLALPTRDALSV